MPRKTSGKKKSTKGKMSRNGFKKTRRILNQTDVKGVERKNIDVSTTFAPPLTASFATPQLLNPVPQGSGQNNHVGRKYTIKSMQYRAILDLTGGQNVSQHRIVVVYDKQTNGAAPIASDVFSTNSFLSPLNLNNADRFVVIDDFTSEPSPTSDLNTSVKRYVKCNLEVICGGTGSAVSDINSGSIYMFIANNSDPTIGSVTGAFVYTRCRFTDL